AKPTWTTATACRTAARTPSAWPGTRRRSSCSSTARRRRRTRSRTRRRSSVSYLHYAADCAAPRIASGEAPRPVGNFDVAVFRERRPLEEPIDVSLRQRAIDASWADIVEEAAPMGFRDAVNLTIDAAMLLPAQSPPSGTEPVLFSLIDSESLDPFFADTF